MEKNSHSLKALRFGPFEADLRAGELRKNGLRLKLQEKPFQILALLLERAGDVVTREELQQRLWPEDTFVDFDNSLNTGISKLREALGESASLPRYIETIPKRGYRLIAPVMPIYGNGNGNGHGSPGPTVAVGDQEPVWNERETEEPAAVVPAEAVPPPPAGSGEGTATCSLAPPAIAIEGVAGQPRRPGAHFVRTRLLAAGALLSLLAGVAVLVRPLFNARPVPGRIMVAVLPFANLSGNPDEDYFSDGMTEEMIAQLGALRAERLGVIARTSALKYKGTHKDVAEIGKELNVEYLVEGSVRRRDGHVRINVRLIQVRDGTELWTESYERGLADVMGIQKEVAQRVARSLALELLPRQPATAAVKHAPEPAALDLYLRGRFFWNKRTEQDIRRSIELFRAAIDKDNEFARAYSGLADAYIVLETYSRAKGTETRPLAREAAMKAVQLDPESAEAHTSLAGIRHVEWDWAGAEREFRRAIELNRNYATAHQWYSEYLAMLGRHEEAIAEARRAVELDPLSPVVSHVLAFDFYVARRYNEASAQYQKAIQLNPGHYMARYGLAYVYEVQGRYTEAVAEWAAMAPDAARAKVIEQAFAAGGYRGLNQMRLDYLKRMDSEHHSVPPLNAVRLCVLLGRYDEAFLWLERAYDERRQNLGYLRVDPVYDPIRNDPRYHDLLRRIGIN